MRKLKKSIYICLNMLKCLFDDKNILKIFYLHHKNRFRLFDYNLMTVKVDDGQITDIEKKFSWKNISEMVIL